MGSEERIRELILRFTESLEWLPSVSQDITDAIHAELADVDADPELRASTYASTDSVLRLIVDLSRTGPRLAKRYHHRRRSTTHASSSNVASRLTRSCVRTTSARQRSSADGP